MALSKTVSTAFGVNATYWKIDTLVCNRVVDTASVVVSGYLDQNARNSGAAPLICNTHNMGSTDYAAYFAPAVLDVVDVNVFQQTYDWLKTLDFFQGATDV